MSKHVLSVLGAVMLTLAIAASALAQTTETQTKTTTVTKNPDGTYTIRMEASDTNATTAGQNNQGTFTFVKGAAPQMQTGLSNGGFTNVTINFTPAP